MHSDDNVFKIRGVCLKSNQIFSFTLTRNFFLTKILAYAHLLFHRALMILILTESTTSIQVLGRGRNKFENLCPIPLKKDSIKYVQTISILGYKMEYVFVPR